jgi:hypothetical protein
MVANKIERTSALEKEKSLQKAEILKKVEDSIAKIFSKGGFKLGSQTLESKDTSQQNSSRDSHEKIKKFNNR